MAGRPGDIWLAPHRPLFLAVGLWAISAIAWWQWGALLSLPVPSLGGGAGWHAHEMLIGFGGAAVAAYILTALPGWTGRPAPSGAVLKALVACWLLQRVAIALAGWLPVALTVLPGLAYFGALAVIVALELIRARAWHRLAFVLIFVALGGFDLLFVLGASRPVFGLDQPVLTRALVMVFVIKISVIGGRMLPAFTANWLRQRGHAGRLPVVNRLAGWLGLAALVAAFGLTLAQAGEASGVALIAAGMCQLWRMASWRGRHVLANPLLVMMHTAFAWLGLGLIAVGLVRLVPGLAREADVVHVLTMGAMAGMILAVAARAAARRDGGVLRAGPVLIGAFVVITAALGLRLAVILWPQDYLVLTGAAALVWIGGWGLFLAAFAAKLTGPVERPVFSGTKA